MILIIFNYIAEIENQNDQGNKHLMQMITNLQDKVERLEQERESSNEKIEQLEQKVTALEQEKEISKNESMLSLFDQSRGRYRPKRERRSSPGSK